MHVFECAICAKSVVNALTCRACQEVYDLQAQWAQRLIRIEKDRRNAVKRDIRNKTSDWADFSEEMNERLAHEGEDIDEWDVISGGNVMGLDNPYIFAPDEPDDHGLTWDENVALWLVSTWGKAARLTEREKTAVVYDTLSLVNDESLSSEHGADLVSLCERKRVSPAAYRRRLCDARRKLRKVLSPILNAEVLI